MKTFSLNTFGIEITWDGKDRGGASIQSSMKEADTADNLLFNSGVDGIESMVLAHWCSGIDIRDASYLEGIETAYYALGNNCESLPLASDKADLQFAIHLENGLVRGIFCRKEVNCSFAVFDYDTEGLQDDEISQITQPNGEKADAYIQKFARSTIPAINLSEVFENHTTEKPKEICA